MGWSGFDTWIVIVASLCAVSCALLGNYLILRRLSMMGDAISHTVLPGIVLAFMIGGSRSGIPMFIGAMAVGLVTVFLVQLVNRFGDLEEGASMGVVFTSLFAVGLILIHMVDTDLDPSCVLYGAVELVVLDTRSLFGWDIPRAAITNGVMLLVNVLFVTLFYKELKLTSFDPVYATTVGFNARALHYLFMTLVAATVVAAFESVGSILVIAMLIVPGACAYLLTDRLSVMILISVVAAVFCALAGHAAAVYLPLWTGMPSTSTPGLMGVVAGLLFGAVALLAPRHGVLSRWLHRSFLSVGIIREDIVAHLFRRSESGMPGMATGHDLRTAVSGGALMPIAVFGLKRRGWLENRDGHFRLTPKGEKSARRIIRSHRLWETYLVENVKLKPDHVHSTAERLEHITDREMRDGLRRATNDPDRDPHAASIPAETEEGK